MATGTHDPRTDLQLIAAANAGDARAFETLFSRYRDWVVNLAIRFTGDRESAMDVMQETFTYLLGKFPGFELSAQFKTFLYPVVRHNALAMKRQTRQRDPGGDAQAQCSDVGGPIDDERLAALRTAVDSLDAGHREVLLLRFADQLSLQEIALAMQIPLGTVKSRLHNALAHLRANKNLRDFFPGG